MINFFVLSAILFVISGLLCGLIIFQTKNKSVAMFVVGLTFCIALIPCITVMLLNPNIANWLRGYFLANFFVYEMLLVITYTLGMMIGKYLQPLIKKWFGGNQVVVHI